jgi:hypothetical protein
MIPLRWCAAPRLAALAARSRGVFRHKNTKQGAARLRLAFNNAAMIANDFRYQRQAKP